MSSSNCCFLTCIQISQESGQVVWYSHLLKNFPHFVVIHRVKGFCIVNKAVVVFLELSCFLHVPADVGNLISGSSAFLNPAWTSGSLGSRTVEAYLENSEHYFGGVWDECNCTIVWTVFGIAFLWDWNEKLTFERKVFKLQTESWEDDFWKANMSIYETLKYLSPSARNNKNRQR